MQYIVTNLNLSTEYTAFFETTIKRKNLKITKKSDLLKIFHPDKCADKVEEKKVNILYNHFSTLFFPNEIPAIKNIEEDEPVDLEKLLKVHQNLQIGTILTLTIVKAIVFRLCMRKFKRLQSKILAVCLTSYLLFCLNILLKVNKEYIYGTLKNNKGSAIFNNVLNILVWNYFIKENLNKAYCTTLATLLMNILLITIHRNNLFQFYENSFIANKILDLFFKKKYSNKNTYKQYSYNNQPLTIKK